MKRIIAFVVLFLCFGLTYYYRDGIVNFIQIILNNDKLVSIDNKNIYYREYDFEFVQNTNYFSPSSRQDILNIYYTFLNSGEDKFSFYCPIKYEECLDEIKSIANDQELLSHINNFVHPYNSFKNIETEYDSTGKITIAVEKMYTEDNINEINKKIEELQTQLIDEGLSLEENIKNIHDYIINNSKYDSNRSDYKIINYESDNAYGPLIQGYGLCGGYTDSMELFLEKLNVKNYKISSNNHVWNAVYLNDHWYHLDLTWDDPVTTNNSDLLEYNFFLIDTGKLINSQDNEHIFNENIYSELKRK